MSRLGRYFSLLGFYKHVHLKDDIKLTSLTYMWNIEFIISLEAELVMNFNILLVGYVTKIVFFFSLLLPPMSKCWTKYFSL